jgi:RecB family exonuclease
VGSLVLVPSPLRAARAARRLCDAEGGVLFGPRVLTPEQLLPGLLAAGGERRGVLPPLAERLLALEAGEAAGGPFAGLAPGGGLARALAAALRELRRGEVVAADAARAASDLGGRAGERLRSLAAALREYEERLGDLGALDRAAASRAAAAAVRRGAASEETAHLDLLVADGFSAPSPGEWDLLAALAGRAGRSLFRVPSLAERPDLCAGAESMLRRVEGLHALASRREVSLSLPSADERAPRLARLLQAISGGPGGGPAGEEGCFSAAAGAGEEGEAELAARILAGLVEDGVEPGEILLFAPAPDRAAPLLSRACAARGVPLAAGRAGPLREAPPVRAACQALRAASEPAAEALLALAGSSYLPLPPGVGRLARGLERSGAAVRGDAEGALRRRAGGLGHGTRERRELLASAAALEALSGVLRPFAAPATASRFAAALAGLAAGIRRRAARAEAALAVRDLAALDRLEETAEGLARARTLLGRGDEPLAPARWLALLEAALDGGAAPSPAGPAAGAVELWPLSEAPGLEGRAAVILGCAPGRFPAAPAPEPLLREPERAALNRLLGRGALATAGARRADALLAAAGALAAGREAVACTFAGPGPEGPGEGPSPLLVEAAAICGGAVLAPPPDPGLAEARTEGEALRAAARAARAGNGFALAALAGEPALAGRAREAAARGAMEAERLAAVEARRASPFSGAVPPGAMALPEEWTPSQLEEHARCPFRLLATLGLGLREADGAGLDIDPRDEGSLAHAVLEGFFRERIERRLGALRGAPEEREALRAAAERVFRRFEAEGRVGDPAVWAARRAAVLARLERAVAVEAAEPTGLEPVLVEHRFGRAQAGGPLAFADGDGEVLLRGRIDRVDAGPDRLLVLDYKNSRDDPSHRQKLEREALGVVNFQVPAYLLAAARALPGRPRLSASYVLLRSAGRLAPLELGAGDPLLATDEAGRAAARAAGAPNFADAVVGAVRRIRAGDLPVASRDCSGCAFGAVCRFESAAEPAQEAAGA